MLAQQLIDSREAGDTCRVSDAPRVKELVEVLRDVGWTVVSLYFCGYSQRGECLQKVVGDMFG